MDMSSEAPVPFVGPARPALPHLDQIQRAFGNHDLDRIQAHVGGAAAGASNAIGALAYAQGDHVHLGGVPDLATVGHEAAHIVQQQRGRVFGGQY